MQFFFAILQNDTSHSDWDTTDNKDISKDDRNDSDENAVLDSKK